MVPYLCRTIPLHVVCIVPYKNKPQIKCLCIIELVPKSTVEVVPWEAYEENPSLHPQRESYRYHKKS